MGAVGLSFDGSRRAAYARAWRNNGGWKADIVRPGYDRAGAERDFVESRILEEGGLLARLVQVELHTARSQINEWMNAYEQKVLAGEIGVGEEVARLLEAEGVAD